MAFKKGQSGNPSGRPVSSFRSALRKGLTERLPDLWKHLDSLEGKEWIDAFSRIAPYAIAKLSNIEVGSDTKSGGITIKVEDVSNKKD